MISLLFEIIFDIAAPKYDAHDYLALLRQLENHVYLTTESHLVDHGTKNCKWVINAIFNIDTNLEGIPRVAGQLVRISGFAKEPNRVLFRP